MNPEGDRQQYLEQLRTAGVADPAGDLRRLFDWAYGIGAHTGPQTRDTPNIATLEAFKRAVTERVKRRPVSHIIGRRAFWRGEFIVTPHVLDPRPETELLVELGAAEPFKKVLDLGTGSGCILVSLLMEQPGAKGVGTDVSEHAVLIAGQNAVRHGVVDRLVLPMSDWYEDTGGRFDLIVSNPPYISARDMDTLAPEVRDFEPRLALTDESDGLSAYRCIAAGALDHLLPAGRIMVEIGIDQADAVAALLVAAGLENIRIHNDLSGRPRVVAARAPR